jgi:hypothetical protein
MCITLWFYHSRLMHSFLLCRSRGRFYARDGHVFFNVAGGGHLTP